MTPAQTVVTIPRSPDEAVVAFGDGSDVLLVAGATVVTPQLARGELEARRAVLLHAAGLDAMQADGDMITIGATATLDEIARLAPEPLASAARIPDPEIRRQGTLGGNLHWPGDLHAPLIALGAQVRSAGADVERTEPIEDYLASTDPRIVLDVKFARPESGAYIGQRRTHAATYTVMSVAVAQTEHGIAVAMGGMAPHGVRCPSVEQALATGADPMTAAQAVSADVEPHDTVLASAWYRGRVAPVLITRALNRLREAE